MENKLKELTDKLYGEGLEKGRVEAERLVTEAEAKAKQIVAEAESKAAQIVKQAEAKAADIEKNSMTEIALAGKQAVATIKSEIADLIITKSTDAALKGATLDADFIKSMLLAIAANWNADASKTELKAILPEACEKEFAAKFGASAGELLAAGIEIGYSKDVRTGFKIGEKNGGYYIAFTDESFAALLQQYLRDKVSHLLFA